MSCRDLPLTRTRDINSKRLKTSNTKQRSPLVCSHVQNTMSNAWEQSGSFDWLLRCSPIHPHELIAGIVLVPNQHNRAIGSYSQSRVSYSVVSLVGQSLNLVIYAYQNSQPSIQKSNVLNELINQGLYHGDCFIAYVGMCLFLAIDLRQIYNKKTEVL
jgi:hypothetical protein